jgi:hypothetical protein
MKFADTIFKTLRKDRAMAVESNGIFIPSTLPGVEKSWWRKLKNPFVNKETKTEMVNEAISAHEEQIAKAKSFVEEKKDTVYKDVIRFGKPDIKTLEGNLKRLKEEKTALQTKQLAKEVRDFKKEMVQEYKIPRVEVESLLRYHTMDETKNLIVEKHLKDAGVTEEDINETVKNMVTPEPATTEVKEETPTADQTPLRFPFAGTAPLPEVKNNSQLDNGNDLAKSLAPQVNAVINEDQVPTIESTNPSKSFMDKLKEQAMAATEANALRENLKKEQDKSGALQRELDAMKKTIVEYEAMRKENEELKYSKNEYSKTIAKLEKDMEQIGLEAEGVKKELANARKENEDLRNELTKTQIREDGEVQDKVNAIKAAKFFANNLYSMMPYVDKDKTPMELMPQLNGWVDPDVIKNVQENIQSTKAA